MCRFEGSNGRKKELEAQQNELFCIKCTSLATMTPGLLFSFLIVELYGKKETSIAIPILEKKRKEGLGTRL